MKHTNTFVVKRLRYLSTMLAKYAHRWCRGGNEGIEPSSRMYAWVDEYNDLRERYPVAWVMYCQTLGYSPDHDAYDCLA